MNRITSNTVFFFLVESVYIKCDSGYVELISTSTFAGHFLYERVKTEI